MNPKDLHKNAYTPLGDGIGDDRLGYDFVIETKTGRHYFEAKAAIGEDPRSFDRTA